MSLLISVDFELISSIFRVEFKTLLVEYEEQFFWDTSNEVHELPKSPDIAKKLSPLSLGPYQFLASVTRSP
jgi:hypothetical protein